MPLPASSPSKSNNPPPSPRAPSSTLSCSSLLGHNGAAASRIIKAKEGNKHMILLPPFPARAMRRRPLVSRRSDAQKLPPRTTHTCALFTVPISVFSCWPKFPRTFRTQFRSRCQEPRPEIPGFASLCRINVHHAHQCASCWPFPTSEHQRPSPHDPHRSPRSHISHCRPYHPCSTSSLPPRSAAHLNPRPRTAVHIAALARGPFGPLDWRRSSGAPLAATALAHAWMTWWGSMSFLSLPRTG